LASDNIINIEIWSSFQIGKRFGELVKFSNWKIQITFSKWVGPYH